MSHRLTRITTRTGDDGTTGLADGTRLPKDALRIEALGALDELNSQLGLVALYAAADPPAEITQAQHRLFELGAELALPGQVRIQPGDVTAMEQAIAARNAELPPLREFILPGGNAAAAHCHLARAVCRRAERRLVQLARSEGLNPESLRYLNRLSDLLFVLARVLARHHGGSEVFWQPDAPGTEQP
ncbi:MAG: cob(I)yrinic acid a,c-diamide adenosyltransferase [Chromatiaceae bacterium]|nr:cob(I)yrinic acid a,c-diamide adenosyltransferase [Chromatiaceae bacterium]